MHHPFALGTSSTRLSDDSADQGGNHSNFVVVRVCICCTGFLLFPWLWLAAAVRHHPVYRFHHKVRKTFQTMKRFFKNRSEKEPTPFVIDAAPSSAASSQPSLSISAGGGGGGYGSAAAAPPPAAAVSHRDGPTMVHASAAVAGQAPALNQPLSSSFGHASTPSSFESATRPHNNNMNKEKKRFLSKQQDGVTPFPLDAAAAAAAQYNNPGVATMEGAQPPPPPPPSALPAGPGVKVSRRISLRGAGERAQKAFWGGGGGGGGRDKVQHQPLAPSLPSQQQQQQDDNW